MGTTSSYDWTDVKLTLNSKFFGDDYSLRVPRIKAGSANTVGTGQFTLSDGTRFNPFQTKPQSISVYCDQGFWYGSW
jgi:hypothetical protein